MRTLGNGPRPAPPRGRAVRQPGDTVFEVGVLAIGAVAASVWGGAMLAARLGGGHLGAGLGDALVALVRLPGHLSDPAAAWPDPVRDSLPGPFLYWTSQLLVLAVLGGTGFAGWCLLRAPRPRDGLGVERSARFATRRDLDRLVVPGPTPGRLVLGRVAGRLVAAEPRTSLCVVGPSQSGKTSGLCVPILLELGRGGGAVIAASVKGDLVSVARARRESLGQVKVFDPTCVLKQPSATWSPLRAAASITGAQAAVRALTELASKGGLADRDFWMESAQELLWPLFYLAARANGSMSDVVRWVTTHDRPLYGPDGSLRYEGEVHALLRHFDGTRTEAQESGSSEDEDEADEEPQPPAAAVASTSGPEADQQGGADLAPGSTAPAEATADDGPAQDLGPERSEIRLAAHALGGIWALDDRTRSSIYTTARTFIQVWSDPAVARTADGCEITPEWLLSGDNTLFIVSPTRDQARLRVVFACLVADLVNEAFDIATREGGDLPTKLLVLLDEAANICPVKELPSWCSTCPSHGITLVTVWQDRSQQRQRYTPDGAETIWNNSGAKVILSGLADRATAEVTRLMGEEDHERTSASVDLASGQRSLSTQTARRALVSEDALRRQPLGQALLVYRDLPAMRLQLRPWDQDADLKTLQETTPSDRREETCETATRLAQHIETGP